MISKQELIDKTIIKFADIEFRPVSLYIKQHNKTRRKYFGKTVKDDPVSYLGSGEYWLQHLSIHGKDVSTLWHQRFYDLKSLVEYAINFSVDNDIIYSRDENGEKIWANLMIETGIGNGMLNTGGNNNPRWGGYVITSDGVFMSSVDAAKYYNMTDSGVKHRCQSDKFIDWIRTKELPDDAIIISNPDIVSDTKKIGRLSAMNIHHHAWVGFVQTPDGIFDSLKTAAKYYKCAESTISRRCLSDKFIGWCLTKTIDDSYKVLTENNI